MSSRISSPRSISMSLSNALLVSTHLSIHPIQLFILSFIPFLFFDDYLWPALLPEPVTPYGMITFKYHLCNYLAFTNLCLCHHTLSPFTYPCQKRARVHSRTIKTTKDHLSCEFLFQFQGATGQQSLLCRQDQVYQRNRE